MADFDPEKLKHNSAGSGIGQPKAGPSDVGEGKPQGRGFHKPNEKHTLDEVLKSLQDLIHNDLLHGGAKPAETPTIAPATGTTAPDETEAPTPPDSAGTNAEVPFESVVESLEELVAKDLAAVTDDATPAEPSTPAAAEPETPAPKKPNSTQQTFSFDDWNTPAAAEPPTAPEPENATETFDTIDFDIEPTPVETPVPEPDIPVLTEPVPPGQLPGDDIPVLDSVAASSGYSMAHEIAERIVARLNAERQERGETLLDADMLETLRRLLRDELERLLSKE